MGILHEKHRTIGEKALAYSRRGGQNTGIAFPALGLRVVLDLPTENSLANLNHQISNKKLRIQRREGTRWRMQMFLRMKLRKFRPRCGNSLQMDIFLTKFAGDCECDGLVHSVTYSWSFLLTVELLCLQSIEALLKRTLPL